MVIILFSYLQITFVKNQIKCCRINLFPFGKCAILIMEIFFIVQQLRYERRQFKRWESNRQLFWGWIKYTVLTFFIFPAYFLFVLSLLVFFPVPSFSVSFSSLFLCFFCVLYFVAHLKTRCFLYARTDLGHCQ